MTVYLLLGDDEERKSRGVETLREGRNTAGAKDLDELPGVGPSTAENIIEHRRHNGSFKSVDELASVSKYENKELRFSALLSQAGTKLELTRL